MKIINHLAKTSIINNKKDTIATKITILLAVVILGTIIFILGNIRMEEYQFIESSIGDYQVSLSEVNRNMYDYLQSNKDIKKISFKRVIDTKYKATISENSKYFWTLKGIEILKGKKPSNKNEIVVPESFLVKNSNLKVGSEINSKEGEYKIVGIYDNRGYSFEEPILMGYLDNDSKENLFRNKGEIEAYIWYKNPRDTYRNTRKILKDLNIDYKKSESVGRLYLNKDYLEHKMIYPSGLIPPKKVINKVIESYLPCFLLAMLFSVMIYGAFNVCNNRDMKEIALLKSAGMTEKQVKKLIRTKSFKIAVVPILIGTIISYISANLLLFLVWYNNSISYKEMSTIFGEKMKAPDFHIIKATPLMIIIILLLSIISVYFSAIIPARKSARLKIIEGLNGISENKVKLGKSKINGKVEKNLAKDYFRSYKSTYRTITLTMVISAIVLTTVLVSQSYRNILEKYDTYKSPYNIIYKIYKEGSLNNDMVDKLKQVKGVEEVYVYEKKEFKFFEKDNEELFSRQLKEALKSGNKNRQSLFARIYALTDRDYEKILKKENLNKKAAYILLNKIASDDKTPYTFRKYMPIVKENGKEIKIRYSAEDKQMPTSIGGYINKMPYNIDRYEANGTYLFTKISTFKKFIQQNGDDSGDNVNNFIIKIKTKGDLGKISDECEGIISSYTPKKDYSTTTDLLKKAANKEQKRNENLLNAGIQSILIIIALSNAYNSFNGNLMARKREFQILSTVGMTEKQIKKMIYGESKILLAKTFEFYLVVSAVIILARAYKSSFKTSFAVKELVENINYVPVIVVFTVIGLGIVMAVKSGMKKILEEDVGEVIK